MINPYLFFSGRCQEALDFYAKALDAKVEMVMTFNQSPEPTPPGMLQEGFEDKIMHSSFLVGDQRVMASDGCGDRDSFQGFRLALSVDSEDKAKKYFDGLADGGTIDMPLSSTFWSPCYGMVTDRFNMAWMVMVPGEQG